MLNMDEHDTLISASVRSHRELPVTVPTLHTERVAVLDLWIAGFASIRGGVGVLTTQVSCRNSSRAIRVVLDSAMEVSKPLAQLFENHSGTDLHLYPVIFQISLVISATIFRFS